MADTLPNVPLDADIWVDLYAASGIAVGTQIKVQNIGVTDVRLFAGAAAPTLPNAAYVIVPRAIQAENETGDAGAWAFSPQDAGLVNVREA